MTEYKLYTESEAVFYEKLFRKNIGKIIYSNSGKANQIIGVRISKSGYHIKLNDVDGPLSGYYVTVDLKEGKTAVPCQFNPKLAATNNAIDFNC